MSTHSSRKTAGRFCGLILLAWLALPVIVLGWLWYGCRWLLTAFYQLARVIAAGLLAAVKDPGQHEPGMTA